MSSKTGQRTAKRRNMKATPPPPPKGMIGGGDGNGQPGGGFLFRLNVTTPIADPTVAAALLLNDPNEKIQPAREALEFVGQKMEYDEAIELRGQLEQAVFIAIHHNTFAGIGTGFMVDDQRFTVQDVYNKIGEKDGRPMVIFTAHLEATYVLSRGVRVGAHPEHDEAFDKDVNEFDTVFDAIDAATTRAELIGLSDDYPLALSDGQLNYTPSDIMKLYKLVMYKFSQKTALNYLTLAGTNFDDVTPARMVGEIGGTHDVGSSIRDADIADDVKDHERDDAAERDDL